MARQPTLRLPDRVRPGLDALLVGINPGLRSALLGHHFAGRGNRFWDLLHAAGLTPRRLSFAEDALLPDLGLGITNIAARPTRSSSDLGPRDFAAGRRILRRKIARLRPGCIAFVGVTAYREFFRGSPARPGTAAGLPLGPREETIGGAPVFVLPNPSGRNAHCRPAEMLRHYRAFAGWLEARRGGRPPAGPAALPAAPVTGRPRGGRPPTSRRGPRRPAR